MLDVSERDESWRVAHIDRQDSHTAQEVAKIIAPMRADTKGGLYKEKWVREYPAFKYLPVKTKEAVAVLSMHEILFKVKGVGQKIAPHIFWIDDTPEILKEYEYEDE